LQSKRCARCDVEKAIGHFVRRSDHPHLFVSWCRACKNEASAKYQRKPEQVRKHCRLYRLRHPELVERRFSGLGKFRFNNARSAAKRHRKEWNLEREGYYGLICRPCEYCGGSLPKYAIGLDRVNTKLGYLSGNVVPCCTTCNRVKQDYFSYDEMKQLGQFINKLREASLARPA